MRAFYYLMSWKEIRSICDLVGVLPVLREIFALDFIEEFFLDFLMS